MELASSPPPKQGTLDRRRRLGAALASAGPARRPAPAAARRVAWSPARAPVTDTAGEPDPDPSLEIAWTVALIELRAAELALAEVLRRDPADVPPRSRHR